MAYYSHKIWPFCSANLPFIRNVAKKVCSEGCVYNIQRIQRIHVYTEYHLLVVYAAIYVAV